MADGWKKAGKKALEVLRRRGPVRWGLLGALALLQAFLLFSALMWWLGSSAASATANVAPMTWTGIVYDVGAAGVNMRSDPQVRPDDARDTAMRGARLALACGETGDVVAKGAVKTATWVKTTDGLFVSMLYIRVPDRQSIPSCNGSKVDGPLLALADPAHPQLPPPPSSPSRGDAGADDDNGVPDSSSVGGAGGVEDGARPLAPGRSSVAALPDKGLPAAPPGVAPAAPALTTPPGPSLDLGQGTGKATPPRHKHHHSATSTPSTPDPNVTPVG
jgi:hypothetical protein